MVGPPTDSRRVCSQTQSWLHVAQQGSPVGFWQGNELGHPRLLMQLQGQLQCRSNT